MKVKIPFIIVLTLFFMGCNSNKEVKVENKTKTTKINFILETSGSMKGYFEGGDGVNDFKKQIANIIINLNNQLKDKKLSVIRPKLINDNSNFVDYNNDLKHFISDINNNSSSIFVGKDTKLDKIFENIFSITDTNTVSILVSDCILSTYGDINKDLQALMANIALSLSNYNDLAISIYKFNSLYSGYYYPGKGGSFKVQNIERPYYFVFVGRKDIIKNLISELSEDLKNAQDWAHFGYDTNIEYKVLQYTKNKSLVRYKDNYAIVHGDEIEFKTAINLNFLSKYKQKNLQQLLNLETNNNQKFDYKIYKLDENTINDIDNKEFKDEGKEKFLKSYTHILSIIINNFEDDELKVKIKINNSKDWYYDGIGSTYDDNNLNQITNNTTFALFDLMNAFSKSFKEAKDINFSMNIRKVTLVDQFTENWWKWLLFAIIIPIFLTAICYWIILDSFDYNVKSYWIFAIISTIIVFAIIFIFKIYGIILISEISLTLFIYVIIYSLCSWWFKKINPNASNIPF